MTISFGMSWAARVRGRNVLAILAVALTMVSCTSVDQMYAAYQKGDESQLGRLVQIAGRPDYPYATRKSAVRALGEIGSNEGLTVLLGILHEFDRRTSLKEEALVALGRIGDRSAVTPIGRLLDRSLTEPNADLRMTAMPVLSQLGGPEAAEILVNALMYYDVLMTRAEQQTYRGVFTGDEQEIPALRDTLRQPGAPRPGINDLTGRGASAGGFFGSDVDFTPEAWADTTPKERDMAHESLVGVGSPAVKVIQNFLESYDTTTTLRQELAVIVGRIQEAEPPVTPADGG